MALLLILIAVFLFALIIFVHELGHFLAAKLMGVRVNEFAIGMGPTLLQFQRGETKYSLRALPIGGFCAMEGEDEKSDDEAAFGNKPVWRRIFITSAGVLMNFLLGFLLMMIILSQQNIFASTTVAKFADGAVSSQHGLCVGDKIISVNGQKISTDRDLIFGLSMDEDFCVDMVVLRGGEKVHLDGVRFATKTAADGKEILALDFWVEPVAKTFVSFIAESFHQTVSVAKMVWASLLGLFTGRFSFGDLAGPVGTASAISEAASLGLEVNFLQAVNNIILMMVMITVNLGVFNLLPIPALDGGRIFFLLVEGVRRKPIDPKYEGLIHAAGFAVLIAFMILVTFSDVARLITGKGFG